QRHLDGRRRHRGRHLPGCRGPDRPVLLGDPAHRLQWWRHHRERHPQWRLPHRHAQRGTGLREQLRRLEPAVKGGREMLRVGAPVVAAVAVVAGCAAPTAQIPDVTGEPVADAVAMLEDAGFGVVIVGGHELDDVVDWTISSHSPQGEERPCGETIRLNVHSALEAASKACDAGRIGDDGRSLVLDTAGQERGSGDLTLTDTLCVLEELDVPDVVLDKMGATRSLDGRQEDSWGGIEASWAYHPDDGLDVILELERTGAAPRGDRPHAASLRPDASTTCARAAAPPARRRAAARSARRQRAWCPGR